MRAVLFVLLVGVLAGCSKSESKTTPQSDRYGDAMKVLVAEQKQLEWIDKQIKELDDEHERKQKEFKAKQDELFEVRLNSAVLPNADQRDKEWGKAFKAVDDRAVKEIQKYLDSVNPWRNKRRDQLERIEEARKAVDAAK